MLSPGCCLKLINLNKLKAVKDMMEGSENNITSFKGVYQLLWWSLYPPYECTWGILWFSRHYAAASAASADTSSFSSDCFHILYVDRYRWEDSCVQAIWTRSDYLWVTQGPPNSQKCNKKYIVAHIWKTGCYFFSLLYICLLCVRWGLTVLKFSFTWFRHKGPPNMKKNSFSYFGFKLTNFLSDCFLIWHVHVHRYGWEDICTVWSLKTPSGPPK